MAPKSKAASSAPEPPPLIPIADRDAADKLLGQFVADLREFQSLENSVLTETAAVRKKYEKDIQSKAASLKQQQDSLEAWAVEHRKTEFGDKQSLDLLHGTLAFRWGNRTLEFLSGWKTGEVIYAVLRKAKNYIKEKPVLDSKAILEDSDGENPKLDRTWLSSVGIKITREERFNIEAKP